ncbi:translin-like [Ruditapes philippinarum]|uniref:translin-like n=1 Tax=Ruditapes philippinarum TaxID=129788 RepID=UPI00295BEBC2|nr:translin-like [Ruditapes philippinarum]
MTGIMIKVCDTEASFLVGLFNILTVENFGYQGNGGTSDWRYSYLCNFTFELLHSRLTVNSVTAGDYGRPMRIAKFVGELDSGFRLLNLKNDSLRKRFDGLKYDLKKVEEVVYDLTIRGLKSAE